jgi:hypothetical protein
MRDGKLASPIEVTTIEPLFVHEGIAAQMLGVSRMKRRLARYDDNQRKAEGKPIQGPPWIREGRVVLYHVPTLREHAAKLISEA